MDDHLPPSPAFAMGSTSRQMDDVGRRSLFFDPQVLCCIRMAVSHSCFSVGIDLIEQDV